MRRIGYIIRLATLFFIGVAFLWGCRDQMNGFPPQIDVRVEPLSGATTDTFTFDASKTVDPNKNSKLYFQWDYGVDGVWNTLPSRSPYQQFRFYKPGDYRLRIKAITSDGLTDSVEVTIPVIQGYSNPRPHLRVSHDTTNILTDILFDASLTRDDENSLTTLQFQWDFQSDNRWDVLYSNNPKAVFRYRNEGKYTVTLLVKDPSGRVAYTKRPVVINLRDPDLFVDFSWSPAQGTVMDTFLFDASGCHHPDYPNMRLTYRWQVEEGTGWTNELTEPTLSYRFHTTRSQKVRLRVTEDRGLFNEVVREVHLDPANKPPTAGYLVSINYGNTSSVFYLSGWLCSDPEDLPSDLEVRWDFDGDGFWDTGYSKDKIVYHRYPDPGEFKTTIQVKDSKGETDTWGSTIHISRFSNETGMFTDTRDGQLYGTVKIGNRWWFAENLKYEIPSKLVVDPPGPWQPWRVWIDFQEQSKWSEPFGKYYHIAGAMENKESSVDDPDLVYTLCPRGWHVPTRADLEDLKAELGDVTMAERLEIGGAADFNMQYLGYVDWYITWKSMFEPLDTVYLYKETYQEAYLYSYEQNESEARVDTWSIQLTRNTHEFWEGWNSTRYFVPIRCVKDQ